MLAYLYVYSGNMFAYHISILSYTVTNILNTYQYSIFKTNIFTKKLITINKYIQHYFKFQFISSSFYHPSYHLLHLHIYKKQEKRDKK